METNLIFLSIKAKAEEAGFKVVFGHTDSIFVGMGDDLTPEEAAEKAQDGHEQQECDAYKRTRFRTAHASDQPRIWDSWRVVHAPPFPLTSLP